MNLSQKLSSRVRRLIPNDNDLGRGMEEKVEREDRIAHRHWGFVKVSLDAAEKLDGSVTIQAFSRQSLQPEEAQRGNPVPGGGGAVQGILLSADQVLVIGRGIKETTGGGVPKVLKEEVGHFPGLEQVASFKGCLVQV